MKERWTRFPVLAVVLVLFMLVSSAAGQVLTGTLTGTVVDPQNLALPGAKVTVVDLATGREHTATTDEIGVFTVTDLQKGFYRVTVEAENFAKFTIGSIQVNVAQIAKVMVKMELAKAGTEIVVTVEQNVVETESAELKNSVDRRQIMDLPLPTRNPLDLVRTVAGIVTPTSSGIADAFVHGLRGNSTNITQDGVNVADNFVKTSSFFAISAPTVDTVGEFNVSVGGIGVDAGFGAAQVNIVTQRGQNDFHGSIFWFQRNNALNANNWFNNAAGVAKPFQLQNRVGVNAGSPVYIPKLYDGRQRTWVFGTFERFSEPQSRSRTRTVLTQSARQGLFSYAPQTTQPPNPNAFTTCGSGTAPNQVCTVNMLAPGFTSPARTLDTAVMNFYNSLVADANTDTGCPLGDAVNIRCFRFNLGGADIQKRYTLRADHQLTRNHAIEFVFNQADFSSVPDLLNGIEPQFPKSSTGSQVSRRQVFTGALHSTFSSNKTNEVRLGFQRAPVEFSYPEQFAATGGFQLTLPRVTSPLLTSANLPQGRNTPVRQVTDNFSWVRGRHTLRFGGEYRQIVANSFFFNTVIPRIFIAPTINATNPLNQNGISASNFSGGISSGDLARAQDVFNIVTGLLGSTVQGFNHTSPTSGFVTGVPRTINPIQHNLAFYFQDSLKLRPNLTITAGVRYDYQGVFDLRNRLILQPDDRLAGLFGPAGVGNFFNPVTTPATSDVLLNFAGANNGKPLYDRNLRDFAPFAGFAWDPWNNGKSSVRGSFALHHTQDGFTLSQTSSTGNAGLFTVVTNPTPTGVFSLTSNPTPTPPQDMFPVSQRTVFQNSPAQNLWVFKPNLDTPYVLEWNLSLSRELRKRVTVEARYVGNHAVKLFRSTDINEINLLTNPFTCPAAAASACGTESVANILTEFKNAQTNLAISGTSFQNQGLAGQVPVPIFEALFNGLQPTQGFTNSAFITSLRQNRVGDLFDSLRRIGTYRANREAFFPLNFFVPNPFANSAIFVDNSSWSMYHGFEFEVRRRFTSGLFLQANYTFSKVLTDARFLTSQQEFQAYRTLRNRAQDRNRAAFDITHSFSANFVYQLPVGKGKWLGGNTSPLLDKFIGGWQVSGLNRWSSGAPFTIFSGRVTSGAFTAPDSAFGPFGEPALVRNMTPGQLQDQIGVFRTPNGVFWLNPNSGLLNISGRRSTAVFCTPGQTTPCFDHPGAGELGTVPYNGLHGPRFFNQDLTIAKIIPFPSVSEHFNFAIRFDFFNAFNNPNFGGLVGGQVLNNALTTIDDNAFGQLTNIVDTVRGGGVTSRIIQWAVRVNW